MAEDNGAKPWASKTCHRSLGGTAISCLGPQCALWSERTAQQADGTTAQFGVCTDVAIGWDMNQAANMLTKLVQLKAAQMQSVNVPLDLRTIKGGRH